jgi:hypothetical protein
MAEQSASARWLIYMKERSPLALLLVIGGGQAVSGLYLHRDRFATLPVVLGAVGIVGALVLMRLMDEVKDEAKDRVAHPERPVPRGLLSAAEVRRAIGVLGAVLIVYAVGIATVASNVAAALYAVVVVWAFLMYKEFFASALLARSVWFYTATHQVIVIPMYLFVIAVAAPESAFTSRSLWFALSGLAASFIVEICRKLDPDADPILGTYLRIYGRGQVVAAVAGAMIVLGLCTWRIQVAHIVWPFIVLAAMTLPILYTRPDRFKAIEGATALLAFAQMLSPAIAHFLSGRTA